MKAIIKVGFCVAYDWELLKKSLPRVYQFADSICLSLDINRKTWNGKKFEFDETAFYKWVKEIDIDGKIIIFQDQFFITENTSIENDNRQRKLMSDFMGIGGWHIQIDADEYFFDFKKFRTYLLSLNKSPTGREKPINVYANAISLIRKTSIGYLYVRNKSNSYEEIPIATNCPEYLTARRNSHFNHLSPFFVLHETWARGEQELLNKINSWGHDNDFVSKESYFNFWKALDEFNYKYVKDFHPLEADTWQSLGYVPEQDIEKAVNWISINDKIKISKSYLLFRNSRVVQGIKQRLIKA